jgi:hypothetical protein
LRSLLSVQEQQLVFLNEDLPEWIEMEITSIVFRYKDNSRQQDNDEERELVRSKFVFLFHKNSTASRGKLAFRSRWSLKGKSRQTLYIMLDAFVGKRKLKDALASVLNDVK